MNTVELCDRHFVICYLVFIVGVSFLSEIFIPSEGISLIVMNPLQESNDVTPKDLSRPI